MTDTATPEHYRISESLLPLWRSNWRANWPRAARLNGVRRWFGMFQGRAVPAVVVNAGPSLESVLPELNERQGEFLVIAVDAALDRCLNFGVAPDLTVTCDPQAHTAGFFENYRPHRDLVALCANQDPGLVGLFEPDDMALYTEDVSADPDNPAWTGFWREIEARYFHGARHYFGAIAPGGTVGWAAMMLATVMGANPVIFAGLDLCFPLDEKRPAHETVTETRDMHGRAAATCGAYAQSLLAYRMWFERWNETRYINATGAGLLGEQKGLRVMDFARVCEYHAGPRVDYAFQLRKRMKRVASSV